MNNRPKNPAYARNKNVLVIGGSGAGKTRFWLKPNLLQAHSSYVITDPKGEILLSCGNFLLREGYDVRILNTINFHKSQHYNPFVYIHSEKDILKVVTALITNTKGEGKENDPFWTKAETLLYCALIGYIHYEAPENEQNFITLLEMLNSMDVREDDEDYENPVDLMFKALKKRNPNHFAVRQYVKFKMAAGDDTVLEPWELKSFMKSSSNRSITDSFITTLHVKSDASKYANKVDEARKVFGLKKFLQEFTLLDERHVSEVGLWKDYMIYATLFGIADQVIRDMKKINPEYFNMDQVAQQMADDMTIPMIYSTMHSSTARAVAAKAAREARASGGGGRVSWGGGGGGFSGGGFGGGVR